MNTLKMIIVLLILSGCATGYDVDLNKADQEAVMSGQEFSYNIVASKTEAITSLKVPEDSGNVAIALMEVFKAQAIAGIATPFFLVEKAKLNTDSVAEVGKTIRHGIPILGMAYVSTTALENDRGTTELYSEGGDITMQDSLNRTEVHSVANDEATASTTSTVDSSNEESTEVVADDE